MKKVLILGGTTEGRQLAGALAARGLDVTLSLAGRTQNPVAQGVPTRSGGFGGVDGLAGYLVAQKIALLVDATHPYAARMSANAASAAAVTGTPILALRRPGWVAVPGDHWIGVDDPADAMRALGALPRRVFLALGRNEVAAFAAAPQHAYVIRSVDAVEPPLAVPDAAYVLARGPFSEAGERLLFAERRIEAVVCKNSGGAATYAKLAVAREMRLPVYMIRRPSLPEVPSASSVKALLPLVDHALSPDA